MAALANPYEAKRSYFDPLSFMCSPQHVKHITFCVKILIFSIPFHEESLIHFAPCMYMHGFTLVYIYIYIYIYPIYLWGINSGKAPNEKVLFQKKGSKYKHLEVKCYVLSRVGWKPERKYIKIRAFCLKHFPQSCHMRSIFAKRVVPRKSTFLNRIWGAEFKRFRRDCI